MAEKTSIAWTDHTFNPWWGCEKVSPGCKHCYAEALSARMGKKKLWRGERERTKGPWRDVPKWNAAAIAAGQRARVFCASMADFFEDRPELAEWRAEAWELIRRCRALDWQLLTKRPENIARMLPADWGRGWPHVWLGASTENQERADERIPILAAIPARIRFVSYEPALGPVEFYDSERWPPIHWVIYGGESGPGRRPDNPDWASDMRGQCIEMGAAFFYKQSSAPKSGWQHPSLAHLPREFPNRALPLGEVNP
jgi:protein gp37